MSSKEPQGSETTSVLRKMQPTAKLPRGETLAKLSEGQRERLEYLLDETAECVIHPDFRRSNAEQRFTTALPEADDARKNGKGDRGFDWLAGGATTAFSADCEQFMFLRFNYCRYRLMKLLREYRGRSLSAGAVQQLLTWDHEIETTRDAIVRANIALVLAMAKRTKITNADPADLISEGNLALLRSVDKFDCSRGYKFSTYACRAILKSFSRVAARTSRYRGYFPTEFDPTLEKSSFLEERRRSLEEDCMDELRAILGAENTQLSEVEQTVIRARFALDETATDGDKAKTLEQVGQMIGVTKERVRQIQNKALDKLKVVLEDRVLAS